MRNKAVDREGLIHGVREVAGSAVKTVGPTETVERQHIVPGLGSMLGFGWVGRVDSAQNPRQKRVPRFSGNRVRADRRSVL